MGNNRDDTTGEIAAPANFQFQPHDQQWLQYAQPQDQRSIEGSQCPPSQDQRYSSVAESDDQMPREQTRPDTRFRLNTNTATEGYITVLQGQSIDGRNMDFDCTGNKVSEGGTINAFNRDHNNSGAQRRE